MQTAFNNDPAPGIVGSIAESGDKTVRAKFTDGVVRVGQYVIFAGDLCKHPVAQPTAQTRGGVVVRNPYRQDLAYVDGEVVDVLVEGSIWVASENAALVDTQAFVRCVAAGAEQLGAFRTDADGTDAFAIPGLTFRSAGTGLVMLEVNHL